MLFREQGKMSGVCISHAITSPEKGACDRPKVTFLRIGSHGRHIGDGKLHQKLHPSADFVILHFHPYFY